MAGGSGIGRVKVWINVQADLSEVAWEEVVSGVIAECAEDWCCRCGASGWCVCVHAVRLDLKTRVGESRVTQAEAKLVDRFDSCLVKVSVVDEDSLGELVLGCVASVVRRVYKISSKILTFGPQCEWQLSAWIVATIQDISKGVAALLARKTSVENGSNVGIVVPVCHDDWADAMDDNDGVVALGGDILDESVSILPDGQVVAITDVTVHRDVSFTGIGIDKYNGSAYLASQRSDLTVCPVVGNRLNKGVVLQELVLNRSQWADQVREVSGS